MNLGCGRAADQQGDGKALPLHLGGNMYHLVQRRCDQTRQPDHIDIFTLCRFKDFRRWHHDAKVNDFVVVAGQHNANDVFTDIMHIALHCCHEDLTCGLLFAVFFGLDVRRQNSDGLFHHAGGFHHLGEEHFTRPKEITEHVHTVHQWPLNHVERAGCPLAGLFGIGLNEFGDAVDQGVFQSFFDRGLAPRHVLFLGLRAALTAIGLGKFQHPLCGIETAVENHIFAMVTQFRVDLGINGELSCVHDAHVHAVLDCMVEEHGMHRFSDGLVSAEGKRQV